MSRRLSNGGERHLLLSHATKARVLHSVIADLKCQLRAAPNAATMPMAGSDPSEASNSCLASKGLIGHRLHCSARQLVPVRYFGSLADADLVPRGVNQGQ